MGIDWDKIIDPSENSKDYDFGDGATMPVMRAVTMALSYSVYSHRTVGDSLRLGIMTMVPVYNALLSVKGCDKDTLISGLNESFDCMLETANISDEELKKSTDFLMEEGGASDVLLDMLKKSSESISANFASSVEELRKVLTEGITAGHIDTERVKQAYQNVIDPPWDSSAVNRDLLTIGLNAAVNQNWKTEGLPPGLDKLSKSEIGKVLSIPPENFIHSDAQMKVKRDDRKTLPSAEILLPVEIDGELRVGAYLFPACTEVHFNVSDSDIEGFMDAWSK